MSWLCWNISILTPNDIIGKEQGRKDICEKCVWPTVIAVNILTNNPQWKMEQWLDAFATGPCMLDFQLCDWFTQGESPSQKFRLVLWVGIPVLTFWGCWNVGANVSIKNCETQSCPWTVWPATFTTRCKQALSLLAVTGLLGKQTQVNSVCYTEKWGCRLSAPCNLHSGHHSAPMKILWKLWGSLRSHYR